MALIADWSISGRPGADLNTLTSLISPSTPSVASRMTTPPDPIGADGHTGCTALVLRGAAIWPPTRIGSTCAAGAWLNDHSRVTSRGVDDRASNKRTDEG